jgi:hypothetical protein
MSEKPVHSRLRRLVDWINLTGAKKVRSLIDKVYKRKNLEMAWEKVKANRGSGGVDGQTLEAFEAQLNQQLEPAAGVCQDFCVNGPVLFFGGGGRGLGPTPPPPPQQYRRILRFHYAALSSAGIRSGHRIVKWFKASRQ